VLVALALTEHAEADERPPVMPLKAPPVAAKSYDWGGLYIGGHFGAAWGHSDWSAAGGSPLGGSFDLARGFNAFKGTGSYFGGLQAGYNVILPNRVLLGAEADMSFPNTIDGSQTFSSASAGSASFAEQVQFFGTVRGRLGYAPGNWLIYATGGFAFSYDELTRTQLTGTPVGGTATPGTVENRFMVPRAGWTAGAGVEVALAPRWSARIEYLYTQFNTRSVAFPAGAQAFASDLSLQSLRLGLNYKIDQNGLNDGWSDFLGKGPSALELDRFAFHGQTTYVQQYVFPFRSPYRGQNSLNPNQGRQTSNVLYFLVTVTWRRGLMATRHEDFVTNPQIMSRHQVVTGARGNVEDVLRTATQMIKHVLEGLQARLVGLSLLSRVHRMKRRTELCHVVLDLIV